MHLYISDADADAFETAKKEAIRAAIKGGVRPIRRPKGLKVDESNCLLLPDIKSDLRTGLEVGQKVHVHCGKLCPWGLEAEETHDHVPLGSPTPHDLTKGYVLCFVNLPFVGKKCRLEVTYVALAYALTHGGFAIDTRVLFSEPIFGSRTTSLPQLILLPLDCLELPN